MDPKPFNAPSNFDFNLFKFYLQNINSGQNYNFDQNN
jgi:hypothetical protein